MRLDLSRWVWRNLAWLERGGIYAVANIRGGDEFGETWHRQGRLTAKQNVFDDFTAAAQALVSSGWTSPRHLGIMGGSNGGLLMGAALIRPAGAAAYAPRRGARQHRGFLQSARG